MSLIIAFPFSLRKLWIDSRLKKSSTFVRVNWAAIAVSERTYNTKTAYTSTAPNHIYFVSFGCRVDIFVQCLMKVMIVIVREHP